MKFKEKLDKAFEIHRDMRKIIDMCERYKDETQDPWSIFWDSFWDLSKEFPFKVEWTDFDEDYEKDMKQRFYAIDLFISEIKVRE